MSLKLKLILVDSPVWAVKRNTCLLLGLDLRNTKQLPRICNNCICYWENKLKRNVNMKPQPLWSGRMSCDCPFDPDNNAEPAYKRLACEQFKALLSGTCVTMVSQGHCATPSSGPKVCKLYVINLKRNRGPKHKKSDGDK